MLCLFCRKKIGLLRRLTDSEYCSQEHRIKMRTQSARALRNNRDYDSFDDYDSRFHHLRKADRRDCIQASPIAIELYIYRDVRPAASLPECLSRLSVSPMLNVPPRSAKNLSFGSLDSIRRTIRSYATVKLQDDFKGGLGSWISSGASSGRDWSFKDGFVRPAKLRIWKESVHMTDYQLEFVGEIEQKGMSWAYRAKDARNYYANKIVITKPGPLPSADLVRYAVINGVERARSSTPLNLSLAPGHLYRVQMIVKGRISLRP